MNELNSFGGSWTLTQDEILRWVNSKTEEAPP